MKESKLVLNILLKIWYLQLNITYIPALKPVSRYTDFNEKISEQDAEWKHETLKMNSAQPLQIS
jgi:hypothetical protein